MKIGFTSTSLRNYNIGEVVGFAVKCKADVIEWGTDFHIKTVDDALKAKMLCDENGITIRSLGTYYKIGSNNIDEFKNICELGKICSAKYLRTWLGEKGSADTTQSEYKLLINEALELSDIAASYDLIISNECHHHTFNDTTASSLKFIEDSHNFIKTYYQSWYVDRKGDFEKLEELFPFVSDVHISFSELKKFQNGFIKDEAFITDILRRFYDKNFDGCILIEFTEDNKGENLIEDINRIRRILTGFNA